MKLQINGDRIIDGPKADDIRKAVMSLDASGDAFLILSLSDMTYIQCSGDAKIGFDLEYQEEAITNHFRAMREDFTAEEIIALLSDYERAGTDWKEKVEWEKITF